MRAQSVPDSSRLRYVTSRFSQLRGFRQVACGVFLLLAFAAMEMDNNWTLGLLAVLFVALGLCFWRLGRYYEHRFGRVEATSLWPSANLREGAVRFVLLAAFLLPWFLLPHSDYGADLGISWLAAFIFIAFFVLWGYPKHYLAFAAPYALLALLHPAHPHWLRTAEVWSVPVFLIIGGLLDHRLLVRSLPGLPGHRHD
jgi:hypothetical protein